MYFSRFSPIFKTGDETLLTNYRHVLSVYSKILELIMYNKIYKYIMEHKLLYNKQFGFQSNNSTEHAILNLVDDIRTLLIEGEFTLVIFIDLSKAFDTVDHHILLQKLKSYGIRNTCYD